MHLNCKCVNAFSADFCFPNDALLPANSKQTNKKNRKKKVIIACKTLVRDVRPRRKHDVLVVGAPEASVDNSRTDNWGSWWDQHDDLVYGPPQHLQNGAPSPNTLWNSRQEKTSMPLPNRFSLDRVDRANSTIASYRNGERKWHCSWLPYPLAGRRWLTVPH